ncbi:MULTISPECIES: NAD-dependent epimerase/dehydratase family protein [Spirulina sp. CCY15215]|uniref:NAD-dependent epimerase/dehydratase family protein n=1 Tax=Spirulina sp. CCY15215 TaxID=2767591 RepID=UPI001950E7C0|nr:NAD-dependent epimerase/dehydratase family protein [Spirulina major]
MKVVVTGSSGHIGFNVAKCLCDRGFSVHLLVRKVNANIITLVNRGANYSIIDFQKPETYASLLTGIDCLFHLAAENTTDRKASLRILESTIGLTSTLLKTAAQSNVKTIVYTSSVVVLGRSNNPKNLLSEADRTTVWESPYIEGKVEADRLCDRLIVESNLDIRRIYPSWVVGPGDLRGTPPHQLINNFLQKGQNFFFNGGISIADVEAVARGHVEAWLSGQPQESYILAGENITFRDFFTLLADISGKTPPFIPLPKWAIVLATVGLKALLSPFGKEPPLDPQYARSVIGNYSWYDSSKAIRELNYQIPTARTSLERAILGERKRLAGVYSLGLPRHQNARTGAKKIKEEMPPLLLTGVPGWLGNRFIDILINGDLQGQIPPSRKVRLLVEQRNANLLDLPDNFEIFPGDIGDAEAVFTALDGIGTVFHLAGAIYPPRIETLYRVNEQGTRNLVDQCIRRGVRRILYMGTDSICGQGTPKQRLFNEHTPDNPYRHYGRSKWKAERYILEKSIAGEIDGTSLRGFWFFGPYAPPRQQKFFNLMRGQYQPVFGHGKNYRSISHVDNVVSAFLAAEKLPATYSKWYWIGDRKADYTVDEIYGLLCAGFGNTYRPIYIPTLVCSSMRVIDAVMGKLGRLHPTIHGIGKFSFDIAGEIDAAQRDFGYTPMISLEEYARDIASI